MIYQNGLTNNFTDLSATIGFLSELNAGLKTMYIKHDDYRLAAALDLSSHHINLLEKTSDFELLKDKVI